MMKRSRDQRFPVGSPPDNIFKSIDSKEMCEELCGVSDIIWTNVDRLMPKRVITIVSIPRQGVYFDR